MTIMFKKTETKLELLTDVNILLIVEKGIRSGICHKTHKHAEVNNKYIKNCNNTKDSSYLMYLDGNNFYGLSMSQKLPLMDFKWKKNGSKFNKMFLRNYDEDNDKGYIFEVDVKYLP